MVRLPHLDVRDQVAARACVLDVRHGDHQVVEGGALGLLGLAQLFGRRGGRLAVPPGLRPRLPTHLLGFGPAADLQTLAFTDGHLEAERDPDVAQVLHARVQGEALHAAHLLAAESTG